MKDDQSMTRDELLAATKDALKSLYGDRLKGLVLFGSTARGEAGPDSDVDLLVLLEGPVELGVELRAIVDALYDLQLEAGVGIEAFPVDVEEYGAQKWPLFREASRDGVPLL
jgi:predicted nucleotidyltransferase